MSKRSSENVHITKFLPVHNDKCSLISHIITQYIIFIYISVDLRSKPVKIIYMVAFVMMLGVEPSSSCTLSRFYSCYSWIEGPQALQIEL